MIAVELEVMAKKFDRFGWDRDRGSMAHDRLITDWMDALQDYPLDEVRAACRDLVTRNPNRCPNEGHVVAAILESRRVRVSAFPRHEDEAEARVPATSEQAAAILEAAGYNPRRMEAAE